MNHFYSVLFSVILLGNFSLANIINVPADYSTIQTAIDSAQVEDTVLVAPGTYVENIDFHGKKITVASTFIYTNDRTEIINTIIDGNADSSVVSIESSEPDGTMLMGFTIRNGLGTGDWPFVRGGGVHISSGAQPTIKNCIIKDNECIGNSNRGGGIYASSQFAHISNCEIYFNTSIAGGGIAIGNGANGTIVDSCNIYSNTAYSAVQIAYSQYIVINRTLIHNSPQVGIRNYGTDSVTVMHSVITNNGDMGITNQADNSQVYLFNSFVGYNQGENIDQDTSRTDNWVEARYSNIIDGTDSLWFGTGCIDTIPGFVDTSAYDFSILSTSPMIDMGDPLLPYDPDGTIADIGVHYFSQGPNSINTSDQLADNFKLHQNYPNPFNPVTNIKYTLPQKSFVKIIVFNMLGQEIKTLVNEYQSEGVKTIKWDGTNNAGKQVPSGVYLYQFQTDNSNFKSHSKKMLLLR